MVVSAPAMDDEPSDESAPETWIGRTIDDRYRVLELLGEGGMGAVFVAEHCTLHKEVALKIVRPEYAGNRDLAARFAREAMVTSRIDHPNVISAIDYGTLPDGSAYLTMELVRGQSLNDAIDDEGSFHWSRAADVGAQLADALSAAATHGIVHRDLKPENVLLQRRDDGTDQVKVLDFGIAKFSRDSLAPPALRGKQQVTEVGVVIGTPGYMAPEQAIGRQADHRADLYSLGVLLWEMCVGRRLWDGETTQDIIRSQLRDNPIPLREATGDLTIPEAFDDVVLQLLSNSPDCRPGDVSAVRDVLRDLAAVATGQISRDVLDATFRAVAASTRNTGAMRASTTRIDRFTPAEPRSTPLAGESIGPRSRRRGTPWIATFSLLALGGVAALVFTDQLELRPKGDLHRIAEQLAPTSGSKPIASPVHAPATAPAEPPPGSIGATGLPIELEPTLTALVQSETRTDRVDAARTLLGHIPVEEVPPYVRALAHFQLAETCVDKKTPLARIAEAKDARSLPALVLTSERGKTGCGPGGRRDCLGCMRRELDKLIKELEDLQLAPP